MPFRSGDTGSLDRIRFLRSSLVQARQRVHLLRAHDAWLRPGTWKSTGFASPVWHHADVAPPETLMREGGKGAGPRRRPGLRGLTRSAAYAVVSRLGPRRCEIAPEGSPRANGTTAVALNANSPRRAQLLALDSAASEVIRLGQAGSFDAEYVALRTRVARHLPMVEFRVVEEDGAGLLETWSHGPLLHQLPIEEQLPHVHTLVQDCANLTRAERAAEPPTELSALPADLAAANLPTDLRRFLDDPAIGRLFSTAVAHPSHGDLAVSNIAVNETPVLFDCDWLGWYPFWFDPVKLIEIVARRLGIERLVNDIEVSSALDALWEAADLAAEQRPALPQLIALYVPVWAWMRVTHGGREACDPQQFTDEVAHLWARSKAATWLLTQSPVASGAGRGL